jgi:glutathione-regulated potassium-efflux system ancillary protein KefG
LLILFAHPALERSRINRRLVEAVRDLQGVTLNDLYEAYPEFDVDVAREQELLAAHDLIVFQHPFYWYSTPALLKQWEDLVLTHGWAYGDGGTALAGKTALSAVTCGGRESTYRPDGFNRHTVRQLLAPIEQTTRLCGMEYLPPFVVHGTHGMAEEAIRGHAADYRRLLGGLIDGTLDRAAASAHPRLNWKLDEILPAGAERD